MVDAAVAGEPPGYFDCASSGVHTMAGSLADSAHPRDGKARGLYDPQRGAAQVSIVGAQGGGALLDSPRLSLVRRVVRAHRRAGRSTVGGAGRRASENS